MNYTLDYLHLIIYKENLNDKLKLYNKSLQEDVRLRKLFVNSRNCTALSHNDVGLFSVFDNYDIFEVLPLSEEEKNQSVIMTKDMEKLQVGSSAICTKDEFINNFDIFTEGILECINWDNVFLAGGSVLAMLTKFTTETDEQKRKYFHNQKFAKSDLDLYIYGLTEQQATKKMYEIYENIKKVIPCECTCVRGSRAISIVSQYPYRHVQIVLRLFKSTRRAHYAITTRRNIVDMSRRSLSYEYRLKKYNERGYVVVIPEFDRSKVNYRIFAKSASQVSGLARLLVLENINDNAKHNLYRDVLNMHQITMYKNLSLNSTYEVSDYSLVFLPWGKEWNSKNIMEHMNNKNKLLNANYKQNDDLIVQDLKNMDLLPQYLCFTGTIYQVVKDNGIKKPTFIDPEHEKFYLSKFVCGRVKWHSTFDNDSVLLGSFSTVEESNSEWYNDAYGSIGTDLLCEYISTNNVEDIIKLIESTKTMSSSSDDALNILLNSRDVSNRNPLHFAITLGYLDICKILLNNGANPMATSKLYKNALHTAYAQGNLDIIKLLLNVGPKYQDFDYNKQDSYGLTPIMYTILYGHTECFKYLYENTVKNNTSLIWIFKHDKTKSYRALEMCLLYKRYDIATYLLEKGYDVHDYYLQDINTLNKKNGSNNRSRNHIMQQAIIHQNINFIKLLIDRNGYDIYKNYMNHEEFLISKIKTTKNQIQIKYTIDLLCYLCKLNNSEHLLVSLLLHFTSSSTFNMEHLKYLIEVKHIDVNYSKNNKTTLDHVLNKLNEVYIQKIQYNFDNQVNVSINNLQNCLNETVYIVSNKSDVSTIMEKDKNKWLIAKQSTSIPVVKSLKELNKLNDNLISFRDYLLSFDAKTYNDINNITTMDAVKIDTTMKININKPFSTIQFKDLDGKVMCKTDKYIKLYTAIKQNDMDTILNLTVKTNRNDAIHLCVIDMSLSTPLSIAFQYSPQLVPELVKIMEMQTIKDKLVKKNTQTNNKKKLYLNNKKLGKKIKEKTEDDLCLYEEEQLDEVNEFAITKLGLNDMFKKYNYIKFCANNYNGLSILLSLDNEVVNKLLYNNFELFVKSGSNSLVQTNDNGLKCLGLLIEQYSKLVTNTEKYKYNLPSDIANKVILSHNSIELLYYLLGDCKKMWTCDNIVYPFDKIFDEKSILHTFAEFTTEYNPTVYDTKLLNELLVLHKECHQLLHKNKLPYCT